MKGGSWKAPPFPLSSSSDVTARRKNIWELLWSVQRPWSRGAVAVRGALGLKAAAGRRL